MKPFVPVLGFLAVSVACSPTETPATQASTPPPDLTDFRSWFRATKKAWPLSEAMSGLCRQSASSIDYMNHRAKSKSFVDAKAIESIHDKYFVHVYVNKIGESSLALHVESFPVGTVIVKEKFKRVPGNIGFSTSVPAKESEILTVMRKREAGFDPKNGNWEYFFGNPQSLVVSNPDSKALKSCQSCHALFADRDFVTMSYLVTFEDISEGNRGSIQPIEKLKRQEAMRSKAKYQPPR